MNIMILSPGRRVDIVQYFKETFHKQGGKVFTLDMSPYAPALYEGDECFLVEKDFNNLNTYIDSVIEICKEKHINSIITLIDPELVLLAENREKFLANDIYPVLSNLDEINFTFDKYNFSRALKNEFNVIPTYNGYDEILMAINDYKVSFPIFAKIRDGSGSVGIGKINNLEELISYKEKENYIFQPYVKEKEYGIDVYFDMIDGKIKSLFIKEKLSMRSGETDKSVSVYREDIINIILSLEKLKFRGPIDVDIFEDANGQLYVNEINPRFGGGYPHAYNCGINFIEYILNNLNGNINEKAIGQYDLDRYMMKYNGIRVVDAKEMMV